MSYEYECPGPECPLCNGEACELCGAGMVSRFGEPPCEHDVIERHTRPSTCASHTPIYLPVQPPSGGDAA